jgi:GAF domain-containing protein
LLGRLPIGRRAVAFTGRIRGTSESRWGHYYRSTRAASDPCTATSSRKRGVGVPSARPTGLEGSLLRLLADTALTLCQADSSGISLAEYPIYDNSRFTWVAAAGLCSPYVCASTPVYDSPCGITIALGAPQLFSLPQRYFEALQGPTPEVIEGLVVEIPIDSGAEAVGTIWVMSHREDRQFDLEDVRVLTSLANFAGATLTVIRARKKAAEQATDAVNAREALEQSEANRENFIAMLGHELRNPMSPIDSAIAAA